MLKKILTLIGLTAVTAAAGVFAVGTGWAAEDEAQSSLVEDYAYPGAAAIESEHKLKVIKGDGHILFTGSYGFDQDQYCATDEIQVEKLMDVAPHGVYYCFKTVGTKGLLTLEVPGTFGVRGGNKPVEAVAELPTGDKTFEIPASGFVPINPGSGNDMPEAILVELSFEPA